MVSSANAASRCPAVAMDSVSNPGSATVRQAGGGVSVTKVTKVEVNTCKGSLSWKGFTQIKYRRSATWLWWCISCLFFQTYQCAWRSSRAVTAPPAWWKTVVNMSVCVLKVSMAGTVSWGRGLVTRGGVPSLSFHLCQPFYFGGVYTLPVSSLGLHVKMAVGARMLMGLLQSWHVTAWLVLLDTAARLMWMTA